MPASGPWDGFGVGSAPFSPLASRALCCPAVSLLVLRTRLAEGAASRGCLSPGCCSFDAFCRKGLKKLLHLGLFNPAGYAVQEPTMMEQVLLLIQEEIKEKQKPSGAWPRLGSLRKEAPVKDIASGPFAEIQSHNSDFL